MKKCEEFLAIHQKREILRTEKDKVWGDGELYGRDLREMKEKYVEGRMRVDVLVVKVVSG